MSTIVQMPVRVKPPPAEIGDTISPGCASFEIAMPLNGARTIVSSSAVCCSSTCRSATAVCCFSASMRAAVESKLARAASSSATVDDADLRELREPVQIDPGLIEPHFVLANRASRRFGLRLGQRQRGAERRIVEPGEDLAFFDGHALPRR